MKYRAYRTKSDNLYHFQFTTDEGTAVLSGDSFKEKDDCFDGIRAVMKAAATPTNYSQETSNGNYFFTISDGSQTVATSVAYDSEAASYAAASLCQKEGPTASSTSGSATTAKSTAAASTAKTSSSTNSDDYRPLAFYESKITGVSDGFDKFEDNGEYYFTYNLDKMVVLISEGYSSEKSRDNGIESVTKNMADEARYTYKTHSKGYHHFGIKAGNHQEVATSRWFNNEADAKSAISILTSGGIGGGKLSSMFGGTSKSSSGSNELIYPDYKALSFYQGNIEGAKYGYESFEDSDKHYFTLNHEGTPVLISETYQSDSGRDKGISSLKKNLKKEERYVREIHPNGKYYFRIIAGNKQEIATSQWFDDEKTREKAISWLLSTGGTRKRKKATRAKVETERVYVTQGASYPCSDITYDVFQSGGNQKYYFVFKNSEGKAILINGDVRGYATPEDAEKAIDKVKKYGPDAKNYLRKVSKTNKHYFFIQDDNEKSVARGSLFYSEEDAMEATIKSLACGAGLTVEKTAAAPPKPKVVDEYLSCDAYNGESGFHTFQHAESKEYYFGFNNHAGKAYLKSQGYQNEAGRDNGIASVKKNAPIDERWGTAESDGKHYFYLRAGNNQEIARSCNYSSAADMQTGLDWIRGGDSSLGKGAGMYDGAWMTANAIAAKKAGEAAAAAKAAKPSAPVDDYLPCEAYKGENGFHTFFNEERKEHYFAFNNSGKTYLRSEGYTSSAGRDNGIESVKKNSPIDARWSTGTALNDKYHFYSLKAGNNQEIARSCYYNSAAAMQIDYDWVRGGDSTIGMGAAMFAGSWMTGNAISSKKAEESAAKAAADAKAAEEAKLAAEAAAKAAAKPTAPVDDYLPCAAYKGESEFHTFFKEDSKEYYFAYNNNSGKTYLRSEGYTSAAGRDNGIASVKKNSPIDERWGTATALNDKYHYYYLKAGNNQEIARSCYYDSAAAMQTDFDWVRGGNSTIGMGAAMYAGAWLTGNAISSKKTEEAAAAKAAEDARLAAEAKKKADADAAAKAAAAAAALVAKKKADAEAAALAAKKKADAEAAAAAALVAKKKAEADAAAAAAKKKAAAIAASAAAAAVVSSKAATPPPPKPKHVATAAPVREVVEKKKGGFPWWLLIPLLLLLFAFICWKGCFGICAGCNTTPPVAPDPAPIKTEIVAPPVKKDPLCGDGAALSLTPNSMEYNLANFLADPEHTFPQSFNCDKVVFGRANNRLNRAAKKQLDNVATVLKECQGTSKRVIITGFIKGERSTYGGSKEVSLDDVRARAAVEYLQSRGIDRSRMSFEGGGEGDARNVEITIRN